MSELYHVTQILKPYQDHTWIPEEAMLRGQRRHEAYASYLLGVWSNGVDPKDQGQYISFCSWVDKYVRRVIAVEIELTDQALGFAGTLDAILMTTHYPSPSVFDHKPPNKLTRPYWAQLAAYEHLALRNGYFVQQSGFLRPDADGGIAKVDWMPQGKIDLFPGFLSCLNSYRFMKG